MQAIASYIALLASAKTETSGHFTYNYVFLFLLHSLENIQDNENPDVYVYTFSPCSPVDCSNYGDSSGVVRMMGVLL